MRRNGPPDDITLEDLHEVREQAEGENRSSRSDCPETTVSYSPLVRSEIDLQCTYVADWTDFERATELIRTGAYRD